MKIYRYWQREERIMTAWGTDARFTAIGGSNESFEDAKQRAIAKLDIVQNKIEAKIKPGETEDYEADIIEEIIREIDPHHIVTRNRYGAEVLNSDQLIFIDIDRPKRSFFQAIAALFKPTSPEMEKSRIIADVEKVFAKPEYASLSCRIYETAAGIRLIVHGMDPDPRSPEIKQLFKAVNADNLYAMLCRRQNCYRARLTPKPTRIRAWHCKHPGLFADEPTRAAFLEHLAEYYRKAERFAVCRLRKTIRQPEISEHSVVRFHDEATKTNTTLPLA